MSATNQQIPSEAASTLIREALNREGVPAHKQVSRLSNFLGVARSTVHRKFRCGYWTTAELLAITNRWPCSSTDLATPEINGLPKALLGPTAASHCSHEDLKIAFLAEELGAVESCAAHLVTFGELVAECHLLSTIPLIRPYDAYVVDWTFGGYGHLIALRRHDPVAPIIVMAHEQRLDLESPHGILAMCDRERLVIIERPSSPRLLLMHIKHQIARSLAANSLAGSRPLAR